MRVILAPTDFSIISRNALNYAADLCVSLDTQLSLLHVYQPPMTLSDSPLPPLEIERSLKEAEEIMSLLREDLMIRTRHRISITTEIRVGGVRSEIRNMADRIEPFAIVMASHGPGAIERLLLGSNTSWAMKHLPWPLILLPPEWSMKAQLPMPTANGSSR